MVKIALITEGVTDQFIIKPIIENYYKEKDFRFTPIQPLVDETDKQSNFGSWTNVVEQCKDKNLIELFDYNDFVIIQIDADITQEKGFDVSHTEKGKQIDSKLLYENITKRLQSFIDVQTWQKYADRFLFAIGIYSIECWLIALVNQSHTNKNIQNCLFRLNQSLGKKNMTTISPKNKNNYKSRTIYKNLSNQFKNKKIINKFATKNIGFEIFIQQIDTLKIK